jgi:hypothetical protein
MTARYNNYKGRLKVFTIYLLFMFVISVVNLEILLYDLILKIKLFLFPRASVLFRTGKYFNDLIGP